MKYITNAFSLNMLASLHAVILVRQLEPGEAKALCERAESIVGHPDTAVVMSKTLGIPIAHNRATVSLKGGDLLIVGQYRGPRLPEGAKELPEGARIDWVSVDIK